MLSFGDFAGDVVIWCADACLVVLGVVLLVCLISAFWVGVLIVWLGFGFSGCFVCARWLWLVGVGLPV